MARVGQGVDMWGCGLSLAGPSVGPCTYCARPVALRNGQGQTLVYRWGNRSSKTNRDLAEPGLALRSGCRVGGGAVQP